MNTIVDHYYIKNTLYGHERDMLMTFEPTKIYART